MQRYNTFTLIHKSLRAMLFDTAVKIQQADFADANEAEVVLKRIEQVLIAFEKHAHHEDNHLLPVLAKYDPVLVETFEKEHVEDELLGKRLKHLINIYRNLFFAEERLECGSAISKAFIDFMVFNLDHMSKEEQQQNPVLWKHFTDEEIKAINKKIVSTISPEEILESAKWMVRGINNRDAISWLKGMKNGAPNFIFQSVLDVAKRELDEKRMKSIEKALYKEEIAA